MKRSRIALASTIAALIAIIATVLVGTSSAAPKPKQANNSPTMLHAGNNYFVCPGHRLWTSSPAVWLGDNAMNVWCSPEPEVPPIEPPPTTLPPVTTTIPPTTTTTTLPPKPPLWKPAQLFEWQWLLSGTLNFNSTTSMGTGVTAWNGTRPPATNPTVYDIDGILNPKSTVTRLHEMRMHAICYIEVGTVGNYYTAAQEGIPVTYYQQFVNAKVIGNKLPGYNEWFLDINAPATTNILEEMISQQCVGKHFDAVETDLDNTFNNNEGNTGFTITQANEERFLIGLARYMNEHGEVWIAKNLTSAGNTNTARSFTRAMEPYAAGTLEEEANQYKHIGLAEPFIAARKPVMNVEFTLATGSFCPYDIANKIIGTKMVYALNGPRTPCDL